jgi:NitT/TauT family transport system permease protein
MAQIVSTDAPSRVRKSVNLRAIFNSDIALAIYAVLSFLLFWEAMVYLLSVKSFILPPPSSIAVRVVQDLTNGAMARHFPITFLEVGLSFVFAAIAGLLVGTAVALVPIVEKTLLPLILSIQTVPKVAVAPLFIIWFGFGIQSKVVTGALIAFFPILINVISGLKSVDPRRILLMRALKASPLQTFLKVRLPNMLPFLFAGLQIGLVFAIIGVIVGEFIGATTGLGVLIVIRQGTIDVAGMFSVLIYLSMMGLTLSAILRKVARHYIFWEQAKS